jgi:ribosomal protein L33
MMEAVSTSETSVNLYETTQRNITEKIGYTVFRKDLKSHTVHSGTR